MRAVLCNQFGPPEDLVVTEVPDPSPGPGEILIEVKAAPVTFPDTLMLEDKYQFKSDLLLRRRLREHSQMELVLLIRQACCMRTEPRITA